MIKKVEIKYLTSKGFKIRLFPHYYYLMVTIQYHQERSGWSEIPPVEEEVQLPYL